jgi:hypothetical protein
MVRALTGDEWNRPSQAERPILKAWTRIDHGSRAPEPSAMSKARLPRDDWGDRASLDPDQIKATDPGWWLLYI